MVSIVAKRHNQLLKNLYISSKAITEKIITDIESEILENRFISSRELENKTPVNKMRIN